jgi:hypothetical protein
MRMRFVRRGAAIGAVVAASLVLGALPASAAPGDGSAYAAKVAVTLHGAAAVNAGPIAPSNSNGPTTARAASVNAAKILTSGAATSSATLDQNTGVVHGQADITDVGIGLAALTGKIGVAKATCDATQGGTTGASHLGNVRLPGVQVAADPARNTTANLPSARIVFNEQVRDREGGLTVNAVHIYLHEPAGTGDIVLSQARCGPACPPVPLASGLGLWLSLGLLGLAAVPGGLAIRRRRAAAA